jgi:hypothetical protein
MERLRAKERKILRHVTGQFLRRDGYKYIKTAALYKREKLKRIDVHLIGLARRLFIRLNCNDEIMDQIGIDWSRPVDDNAKIIGPRVLAANTQSTENDWFGQDGLMHYHKRKIKFRHGRDLSAVPVYNTAQ